MAVTGPCSFFSYSRSDGDFVLRLASDLRADGRAVWVDQLDIPKGARWDAEVERALKASRCVIVILSPESAQSQNVLDEASYAIDEKIPVLPILLRPCSIPLRLKRLQYIDFTGGYEQAYPQVGAALDAFAASGGGAPSAAARPAPPPALRSGTGRGRPMLYAAAALALVAVGIGVALVAGRDGGRATGGGATGGDGPPASQAQPQSPTQDGNAARVQPGAADASAKPADALTTVLARVNDYVAAQNSGNAAGLMRFYADRVDYFDRKGVNRDFILKDKSAYYERWPQVQFKLADTVRVEPEAGRSDMARVSYSIDFRVANPARGDSRTGAVLAEMRWQEVDGRWLIVGQREKVLARGAPAN